MLTAEEKTLIVQCVEAVREGLIGFKARTSQQKMISAVASTFGNHRDSNAQPNDGSNILVVESPTGTGKTLAAVIPALVLAKSRKKRLVYSSSTVALQDQLRLKDLPLLRQLLPIDFSYTVAKGRGRYACVAKLYELSGHGRQQRMDLSSDTVGAKVTGDPPVTMTEAAIDQFAQIAQWLKAGDWTGDRDELPVSVPDESWSRIVTDRQGCGGSKCPYFNACPFYKARLSVRESDVVIVNHNLALAALDMEAGSVLPDPADTIFVFDECHSLYNKVVARFSAKHTLLGAVEWLRDMPALHARVVHGLRLPDHLIPEGDSVAVALRGYLLELHQAIAATGAFEEKPHRRFKNGVLPNWVSDTGGNILAAAQKLQSVLEEMREGLRQRDERDSILAQKLLNEFGFYVGKVDNVVATWELLLQDDALVRSPTARWIEKYAGSTNQDDFLMCAAPLTATTALDRVLWRRASAVVLTSATITSCGTFDLFLSETGLSRYPRTRLLRLDSPFNHQHNARVVIPWMQSDPRDAAAHTREVIELLPTLVSAEGSLVLFASGKAMRDTFAGMSDELRGLILMQGALPKSEILSRHRQAVLAGKKSVIFGLSASFGEGVDLPGALCSCVVIAKIPFSIPTDPWSEAKCEWVASLGKSPFMEIIVPEAGVKLNQNSGRLLRTEADWGVIYILDRRLGRAHWGSMLLKGLPPFPLEVFGKLRALPHLKNTRSPIS